MLQDSAWPLLVLLPFALHFAACALRVAVLRSRGAPLPFDPALDLSGLGPAATWLREAGVWALHPLCTLLLRARVGPTALTLGCALLSACAGVLVALGALSLGGVTGLLGCSLDYFDGRIARMSQRASRSGAFLDGTLDRCGEAAFLSGAALLLRDVPWALGACLLALAGSGVISYARAKAETLGVELRSGSMQRPERVLLFCLGACLDAVLDPLLPPDARGQHVVFSACLALLAIGCSCSALHRMVRGFTRLRREEAAYTGAAGTLGPAQSQSVER